MAVSTEQLPTSSKSTVVLEGATVRLAGDSGDGMQVVGGQFTATSALHGNDVRLEAHWRVSVGFRCSLPHGIFSRPATR